MAVVKRWLPLGAWVALVIIGIAKGWTQRTFDFGVFHTAGGRFVAGEQLYRLSEVYLPFKYAPFTAPLFVPFGVLPRGLAGALWNVCSAIAILWTVRVALPKLPEFAYTPQGTLWAAAILIHAFFFEMERGQADLLMLAAVTGAAVFATTRPWLAGVLGALAVGLKLPALLIVFFFARFRHWRSLIAMGALIVALEGVVFLRYGWTGGLALHAAWKAVLGETTTGSIMHTQGWIPLMILISGVDPKYGMVALQVVGSLLVLSALQLMRSPRAVWFAVLALAMATLSPLCWNPNYLMAWPILILAFNLRRPVLIACGIAAAVLLTTLTPGILRPDVYQTALVILRPYGVLSFALSAFVLARTRVQPG